jgi:hypothetical protein
MNCRTLFHAPQAGTFHLRSQATMKKTRIASDRWRVSLKGKETIRVVSTKTKRTICSLQIADYENQAEALQTAQVIASLSELLSVDLLVRIAAMYPKRQ